VIEKTPNLMYGLNVQVTA